MNLTEARMRDLFELSHGPVNPMAWGVTLRRRFGHFTPNEYYEETVEGLVTAETEWLDVGGGAAIFPNNRRLGQILAERCKRLVVVDPSPNIDDNTFAHERFRGMLEDYPSDRRFDLVSARMVVEHVTDPDSFVQKLGQIVKPGGKVVIYTVSRWSPITVLSGLTPLSVHHVAKKFLWGGEEKDTFPVTYLMNTYARLNALFSGAGFKLAKYQRLDDCRTLQHWKYLLATELLLWKVLRTLGIGYPEACILGVFERT